MNAIFTIGDFSFRIICPDDLPIPDNFMKFQGGSDPVYTYRMDYAAALPQPRGTLLLRRADILILETDGLETRYIAMPGSGEFHACCTEVSGREMEIRISPEKREAMAIDTMFCSLLALERRMMARDGLILHCAFVEYQGEAILFSAPSETGKTTQANLWMRYRGAETVNGDRSLLQKRDGRWYARGWPVCGSSGVCRKKDVPIRAVVMLSQAPEDRAERLSPMKAFSQIYGQITVNRWNREANLRAMALLEDMVTGLPVYHLACTMNETAVEALETALY